MRPLLVPAVLSLLLCHGETGSARTVKLDPLLAIPEALQMSHQQFEKTFGKGGPRDPGRTYAWLTRDRSRAVFMRKPGRREIDLTILDGQVPCDEVTVDFLNGRINGISFSIYNRADGGPIAADAFEARFMACGKAMSERLKTRPRRREADAKQGLLTDGWLWTSRRGMAVLERNPEAESGDFEFLRLRLAPAGASGPIANSMRGRNRASVRKSDLPDHVRTQGNDVVITSVPMVDQGPKGYCVVASIQRLFEYYGIPCDQHQLAQVMESDADSGTNSAKVIRALGKVDYRFKTRFSALAVPFSDGRMYRVRVRSDGDLDPANEFEARDFEKTVIRHIDDGIPLLWSLQLGLYPEEPAISPQTAGGHMRMIIGYNKKDRRIIFTDSWGFGHERKTMDMDHALKATTGLYSVTPTVH
jgi:hypothetical protein